VPVAIANAELRQAVPLVDGAVDDLRAALLVGSIFILASAVIGFRATNTRSETPEGRIEPAVP
jgi:hypothetical protein